MLEELETIENEAAVNLMWRAYNAPNRGNFDIFTRAARSLDPEITPELVEKLERLWIEKWLKNKAPKESS